MSGHHWSRRPEGGSRFGLWLIRTFALRAGRPLARLALYPITLYFLLRRGPERAASRAYLARALERPARFADLFRHMHCFAATTLDRVYLLARGADGFDVRVEGLDVLRARLDQGRGVVLLGAHVGSFEALRALAASYPQVPLRIVLDKGQSPAMTALLDELAPALAAGVIDASRDPASVVLALSEAVAQGHMVALLADRGRAGEATLAVPFLGAAAPFPAGPWQLAAALRVPVLLCFGLYHGGRRYTLRFEPFADALTWPRRQRDEALADCVGRYAARLESQVRACPYNWFNFYDFWRRTNAAERSR